MPDNRPRGAVPVRRRGRPRRAQIRAQSSVNAEARPWLHLNWRVVGWMLGRLAAVATLLGCSWLLYHAATSHQFQVARVRIVGNQLAPANEVAAKAAVGGTNVFQLRPREVAQRIESLPTVASASVEVFLPDLVDVRLRERVPVAVWQTDEDAFLVDETGIVVARAIGAALDLTVRDISGHSLSPGARVDADAIRTAALLHELLPGALDALSPSFEYEPEMGIAVPDLFGWRVRFGSSHDLGWKVSTLQAIRLEINEDDQDVSLVDLRFKGRPYYR